MHTTSTSLAIFFTAAALYALPGFVAILRGRRNYWAILATNILLGWTVLLWVVAFVWACTPYRERRHVRKASRTAKAHSNDNVVVGAPSLAVWAELASVDPYAEWLDLGEAISPDSPVNRVEAVGHLRDLAAA